MRASRSLAVIGASEETVAHLRLLMKLGATRLKHNWRWGEEDAADFVAVEVHDLGCQGVMARCLAAGVPCAIMAEAEDVVVHGMVLRRPFKLDQIVAVLNAAGAASADPGSVEAFADDFYTRDMDEIVVPVSSKVSEDIWAKHERPEASARNDEDLNAASDLDVLIHGDPLAEPEPAKPLIRSDTTLEPGASEPTRRSEGRAEQARHRVISQGAVGLSPIDVAPVAMPPRNESGAPLPAVPARPDTETAGFGLSDYLLGELVSSPSLLKLDDTPGLIVDPKRRVFHTSADLAELEPYALQPLPRSLLSGVSSTELTRVRASQTARPFDELIWLIALATGGGRLASRLDPGGGFQLTHPIKIDAAFRKHGAIVAALVQPARLHEIAARSGASMDQVFDVVSAYDAIHRITVTPRQRLAPETKPDAGARPRFWPFGKR